MRKTFIAALGLAVAISAQTLVTTTASAVELGASTPSVSSDLNNVQYRRDRPGYGGRCFRARRLCRARWGFGWRFRRCMGIRGCL